MFTVSLKKLALGFWWQLLLFPALEVSWSAGLVVLHLFAVMYLLFGLLLYGPVEFSPLWPILAVARLAVLLVVSLLCISSVVVCYWWYSRRCMVLLLHYFCGWKRSWQL